MKPHNCKKPFLCSCEVEELAEKTADKMMEVVREHFEQHRKENNETMIIKSTKKYEAIFVEHEDKKYTRYFDMENEVAYWEECFPAANYSIQDESYSLILESEYQKAMTGK